MTPVSRRSMIAGFATGVAVAVTPAVMATPPEEASARVNRLLEELSDALNDFQRGHFRAIVEPSGKVDGRVELQNMNAPRQPSLEQWLATVDPSFAIEWHAIQLGKLLHAKAGGPFIVNIHDDDNMVVCAPIGSHQGMLVRHV